MPREIGWPPEAIIAAGEGEAVDEMLDPLVALKELRLVDEAEDEAVADVDVGEAVLARMLLGSSGTSPP